MIKNLYVFSVKKVISRISPSPNIGGIHRLKSCIALICLVLTTVPITSQPNVFFVSIAGELRHGTPASSVRFKGIGVNYFDAFQRVLLDSSNTGYREGFRQLGQRNIPFARFNAGGFWPNDFDLYLKNQNEYWRRLTDVINTAESEGVGLIPSLFWHWHTVPDIVGEPVSSWGDPDSETIQFARVYMARFITRFKNSPAILAYEIGNEWNLPKDLPASNPYYLPPIQPQLGTPSTRSDADAFTSEVHRDALRILSGIITNRDPSRAILSGNTIPRSAAYDLRVNRKFRDDTLSEFILELKNDNLGNIDTLSIHAYWENTSSKRFTGFPNGYYGVIDQCMKVSQTTNRPLLIGEFGTRRDEVNSRGRFNAMLNTYQSLDVPLAAVWVYDFDLQPEWSIRWDNDRSWYLSRITSWNTNFGTYLDF